MYILCELDEQKNFGLMVRVSRVFFISYDGLGFDSDRKMHFFVYFSSFYKLDFETFC